jgi:hypothetical protein
VPWCGGLDAVRLGGEIPLVGNLTLTALHLYPLQSAAALAPLECDVDGQEERLTAFDLGPLRFRAVKPCDRCVGRQIGEALR